MPNSRRRGDESAFTLIEMIVVAVLLITIMTFVLQFLMDIVSREQEGVVSKRATERSMVALDQLGQDLRSTISTDRATGGGLGVDDLEWVASGAIPGGTARQPHLDEKMDILRVSDWMIELRVPTARGTTCVRYETSLAARGRLMRYSAPSCPATAASAAAAGPDGSTSVIIEEAPAGVTTINPPFSYTQYADPSCRPVAVATGTTHDAFSGAGSMKTLTRLASVKVNLSSYAQAGHNRGTSKVETEYVFRSRMSAPYQRALGGGCSA